jgi:transcriptional regulator with PAS, ATPase and Fis domain
MYKVMEKAVRLSQVDTTILLQGEAGVGKGYFSNLIHNSSPRKDKPFIRVDAGAIPEQLIESELFGYQGGAFTGALNKGKPGYFEIAEEGTLFLDEIAEIPLQIQVKLLRFLENSQIVRVGDTTTKTINTRVIAATNKRLDNMVEEGKFRKDLFFRLNVIPLTIPPLRERVEDIPLLFIIF